MANGKRAVISTISMTKNNHKKAVTKMICKFSTVRERDMDLLFLEAMGSDKAFMRLFVDESRYAGKDFFVKSIELSRTDTDLGESDITATLSIDGHTCAFLIEDKIDAPAMPNQHGRYKKRADKAIKQGEFESYEIFILCPEKYYQINPEATKYEHFLSYEKCRSFFQQSDSAINQIRAQQISQAIEHAKKPPEVQKNEQALAFHREYKNYQKQHYPKLNLRTKDDSNGWWEHYATRLENSYIDHKKQEGYVDLTFSNAAPKMALVQSLAEWLRKHGIPKVFATEVNKSAALRIEVPQLLIKTEGAFAHTDPADLNECFNAIQALNDFADILADVKSLTEKQKKTQN